MNLSSLQIPSEYGYLRDLYIGSDLRCVVIFQDDPMNWSVRWSIVKILFLDQFRQANVFGRDSAWDQIDTTLLSTIPDNSIRKNIAMYFLKNLQIHPAEYVTLFRPNVKLFGVEDEGTFNQALKLKKKYGEPRYIRHQISRANWIVANLLSLMAQHNETTSVVVCAGDLPSLVFAKLEEQDISCAVIKPQMTHPSDRKLFSRLQNGWTPSLEDTIRDEGNVDLDHIPRPTNQQFEDKKIDDRQEQNRIVFIEKIRTSELILLLQPQITQFEEKRIDSILNSSEYGIREKAVLIRAELLSFIDLVQAKVNRRKDFYFGWIGVITTVVVTLLCDVEKSLFYQIVILVLFLAAVSNSVFNRRYTSSFRWLLYIFGFLGGLYLYGSVGIFIGLLMATLIGGYMVWHENRIVQDEARLVHDLQRTWF